MLGIACLAAPGVCEGAVPVKLSGAISGFVHDVAGVPQMGATVILYDRQSRVYEKALTNNKGEFVFPGLLPDLYSVRITLAAFVPALKKNILVQPGMRSILAVNLNTLFSSIELGYPPIENGSVMTDDWKWALRGGSRTRPVLRFEKASRRVSSQDSERGSVFSETRGIVTVSAGDVPTTGTASQADLGAAFAVATSVYGNNRVEVSGNLGVGSQTGFPVTAFRTGYRRNETRGGPEISVTMRQLHAPGRAASVATGAEAPNPMLRSTSASYDDSTQITERVWMQYGISMDSVTYREQLNYFSPYARLVYSTDRAGELSFAYTSGNARPGLAREADGEGGLQRSLASLGMFPRVSVRDSRPRIQRGEEYEIAYARRIGSRKYQISGYNETVTNAALTMVAPEGMFVGGDVLPDLFSGNSVFNAGSYSATGFTAAITQSLGDHVNATLMYGSMGALTADNRELVSNNPDELRAMIRTGRKRAATARIEVTAPASGTHFIASYQWSDHRWAMPGHLYSTQEVRPMPGFNIYVRQPLPLVSGRPCRVELTADLRNLLAQGYLPLAAANGQTILLVDNPRALRGGLNFIF